MQIPNIRKGFKAFQPNLKHSNENSKYSNAKFKPFERDSKHLNANSNHSKKDLKNSNANSNHSKGIRNIRMQILTIQKGFEGFKAFKCKFDPFERDSMQILNIRNGFEPFERKFKPFERDSKHSNANSYHSKGIRSI